MSFLARFMGKSPSIPLAKIPINSLEIFERSPPWWARWVLVLVAVDTMVTTSMMEFTWFHWGTMEPKAKSSDSVPSGDSDELEFVPRPYSVRSVACFMHFATGVGIAGALLATRSRIIRSIHVAPSVRSRNPQARILVQTATMPFGRGALWTLSPCKLVLGNNKAQMQLQTANHGRWLLDLRGSMLQGRPAPENVDVAHNEFLAIWKRFKGQTISTNPQKRGAETRK